MASCLGKDIAGLVLLIISLINNCSVISTVGLSLKLTSLSSISFFLPKDNILIIQKIFISYYRAFIVVVTIFEMEPQLNSYEK